MANYVFYVYRPCDPPYRRTPEGVYHQFNRKRNAWIECNQNADGLTRIARSKLSPDLRSRAEEPAGSSSGE